MMRNVPLTQDLLLIGGGHAHALVLRAWGMKPLPGARLTVINPGPTAPYTGMLPGHVAGHYGRDELEIDLVRLCRHAGARLILDRAVHVDGVRREVTLAKQGAIAYDVASIDVGITAQMDLPGFAEHGIGAKPLDLYAKQWRAFLEQVQTGQIKPDVAVIGGGVAGCELAMAMAHALQTVNVIPQVTVIEAAPELTGMGRAAREQVQAAMDALGIVLQLDATVLEVQAERVLLASGQAVPAQLCVGAAGAFPHPWIARTALPQRDGFIEVGRDFGVTGDKALFAVGDCAIMPAAPRPKAGVFAVRAAPVLHHNLRVALAGGARKLWRPQKNYLKLISLGQQSALAEKYGLTFAGPRLWRWKDRIDRAFMDRLSDLPKMAAPKLPPLAARGARAIMAQKPMCGGCGAKVGPETLQAALAGLAAPAQDVVTSAGDDAAVLRQPDGSYQVISTDHLRAMVEDHAQMARIAAVHALGDVWAMGAAPQVALASLVLPQMSVPLQERTLTEIMTALRDVIEGAGAQLVGGHTTMGAELTIGLTVTGICSKAPITVSGAREGDRLVLTRPIGAGVLLAADMEGQGSGREVSSLLQIMATPQGQAAEVLGQVAHAMTDVTGFGLAGHVQSICRASGLDAELWHKAIPVYAGARALSDKGMASTLLPANQKAAPVLGSTDPLLHDPQTSGGLLAAVPADQVEQVLADLKARNSEGHEIGVLRSGQGQITLRHSVE